jgi:hypothetical protein
MKKLSFTILFVSMVWITSFASSYVNLFSYDEILLQEQLAEVASIESYIHQNEGLTLTMIRTEGLFPKEVEMISNNITFLVAEEPPLGVPPFVWGLCLGLPGMAVVYLTTEDRELTKKALNGCLVNGLIVSGSYLLLVYLWAGY